MKTIGEVAYDAWAARLNQMSTWSTLGAAERASWEMAAAKRITEQAIERGLNKPPRPADFVCSQCQRAIRFRTALVGGAGS